MGSLENEAKRRREKLLALKQRCRGEQSVEDEHKEGSVEQGKGEEGEELPTPQVLFR